MNISKLILVSALALGATATVQAQENTRPPKTAAIVRSTTHGPVNRVSSLLNTINTQKENEKMIEVGFAQKAKNYIEFDIEDVEKNIDKNNTAALKQLAGKKEILNNLNKLTSNNNSDKVDKAKLVTILENYEKTMK